MMLIGWRDAALRDACHALDGLKTLWPSHGEAAMLLLAAVSHAKDLGHLLQLRSVLIEPSRSDTTTVFVSLEEVQMEAIVVTRSAVQVQAGPHDQFWSQHADARALLVLDLRCQGQSLVQATAS